MGNRQICILHIGPIPGSIFFRKYGSQMTLVQGKCCPDLLRAVLSGQTEGFNGTIRLRPPVDLSLFPGVKYLRLTNQVATFRGLDLETIIQLTNTDGVLMVSKAKMLKLCQRNRLLK